MNAAEKRSLADKLRHYGIESLKLAAELDVEARLDEATSGPVPLPLYQPRFEVTDGIEAVTNRLACCGAGPDQRDERTGERLHLLGCPEIARTGLAACRTALDAAPDWTDADAERASLDDFVDRAI